MVGELQIFVFALAKNQVKFHMKSSMADLVHFFGRTESKIRRCLQLLRLCAEALLLRLAATLILTVRTGGAKTESYVGVDLAYFYFEKKRITTQMCI